jgi:hypothetical protein
MRIGVPVGLPQNADEHRSQHSILLAIDQELGEGAALWVAPELSDPVGSLEVGSIRTWSPLKAAEIKAAESYADTSCLRGYVDLRRRDGDGGVLEALDNSSALDPQRRAWRTV